MTRLRLLAMRLRALFAKPEMDRALDEELQSHFDMLVEQNIGRGLTPEEARRVARHELGGSDQIKESVHDQRGLPFLESLLQDVRYGTRMLRKSTGFTAVALLTLAVGISANTAIFSIINGVLLKPLPYPHPDRLVAISESFQQFTFGSIAYPNFLDWTKMNHTFDILAAYRHGDFDLTGSGDAQHLKVTEVSFTFFPLLGIQPVIGRTFTSDDDKVSATRSVMLSEQLWREKFGSSPGILGKTLTLNGSAYVVVGVVPQNFYFCCESMNFELGDAYIPIGNQKADWVTDRGDHPGIFAIGRLRPGISLERARAGMDAVAANLAAAYPDTNKNSRVLVIPLVERMAHSVKKTLLILFASVGFVLLIACANVANLLLARASNRAREFAVRTALGATRRRMIRQLLTESLLLGITGGALGVLLAWLGTQTGLRALPEALPRANDIGMNLRVLSFTLAVSILSGIFFGLAPALKCLHPDLHDTLKEAGRGSSGARHHRTQSIFVVAELALAVLLLIGAGLTIRSLGRVLKVDPGFDPHNILTFDLSLPPSVAKETPDQIRAYIRALPDEVAKIPGVQDVALSDGAEPLSGDNEFYFWVEGRPKPHAATEMPMTLSYLVSADYLKTMKIPLLRGRFLSPDDATHSQLVGVIDNVFARTYFPNQDPLGHYIHLAYKDVPIQIVGVVGHVKQWGLDETGAEPVDTQLYTLAAQMPDPWMTWLGAYASFGVRTESLNYPTPDVIRSALAKINSEQVAYDFATMDDVISQSVASRQFTVILLGCFAAAALLLASIGIYGVMTYLVAQRTHEFGIRMALGASVTDVLKMVLGQGTKLACAGVVFGIAAAFGLTQLIASLLFGVTAHDPLTFAAVAVLLILIALLACYIPARRAMRVDPMVALRYE
jgi:predicted permease